MRHARAIRLGRWDHQNPPEMRDSSGVGGTNPKSGLKFWGARFCQQAARQISDRPRGDRRAHKRIRERALTGARDGGRKLALTYSAEAREALGRGDASDDSANDAFPVLPRGTKVRLCTARRLGLRTRGFSTASHPVANVRDRAQVIVTGNQRTKSSLVGQRGAVRKAVRASRPARDFVEGPTRSQNTHSSHRPAGQVGLGGWHWLLLESGKEVRIQRNALRVIGLSDSTEVSKGQSGGAQSDQETGDGAHRGSCHRRRRGPSPPRRLGGSWWSKLLL